MHKDVRALVEWASGIGFTCDEKIDGRGHYTLTHKSGATYSIAATPSDWRTDKNERAALRRIAGAKPDGPSHRRSRKAFRPSGFTPRRSTIETARGEEIASLRAEWSELESWLHGCVACGGRRPDDAILRLERRRAIADRLTELHHPVPPSDFPLTA